MLKQHLNLAIRAYNGTSFDPEKRGRSAVASHSAELTEDLQKLGELEHVTEEQIAQYRKGYEDRFVKLMVAKSRCISPMITGPARFPVARNQKALNSEHNISMEFMEWRDNRLKKLSKPPKEDISDLDRYKRDLALRESRQALMKETNEKLRKWLKKPESVELTDTERKAFEEWKPSWSKDTSFFKPFELSNNNARIREITRRITQLEEHANTLDFELTAYPGLRAICNFEASRIQLIFNEKPSEEVRTILKENYFKWAPSTGVWQRKYTRQAQKYTTKMLERLARMHE